MKINKTGAVLKMNNDEMKMIILFKSLRENNPETYKKVKNYLENKYHESQNIKKD